MRSPCASACTDEALHRLQATAVGRNVSPGAQPRSCAPSSSRAAARLRGAPPPCGEQCRMHSCNAGAVGGVCKATTTSYGRRALHASTARSLRIRLCRTAPRHVDESTTTSRRDSPGCSTSGEPHASGQLTALATRRRPRPRRPDPRRARRRRPTPRSPRWRRSPRDAGDTPPSGHRCLRRDGRMACRRVMGCAGRDGGGSAGRARRQSHARGTAIKGRAGASPPFAFSPPLPCPACPRRCVLLAPCAPPCALMRVRLRFAKRLSRGCSTFTGPVRSFAPRRSLFARPTAHPTPTTALCLPRRTSNTYTLESTLQHTRSPLISTLVQTYEITQERCLQRNH